MQDTKKTADYIAAIVFTGVAVFALLVVRFSLFYYESFDYIHSISVWLARYREMTFFEGLGTRVSNYNQPYMYLINIIARVSTPETEIYFVKILSVIFDLALAFFVMKIVSLKTKSMNMHILAFLLAFAIPTVIINSSLWGQCDSIYSALAVGSVYYALSGKSKAAYVFIALALSFKLQAAFILPLFFVFVICKKIKLRDCWVFFAVYLATLLPAFIAGFPLYDLLFVYLRQSNTYSHLSMNAVNIWQLFANVEFEPFRTAGLWAGGAAVLGLMYFAFVYRERITGTTDYIRLAFLFAVFVPFLLPQMHDRFFFMADAFALVLFLYDKRRWYVPLVCVLCSFIAYAWLIMEYVQIFDYRLAALALACMIFIVLRDLVISLTDAEHSEKTI